MVRRQFLTTELFSLPQHVRELAEELCKAQPQLGRLDDENRAARHSRILAHTTEMLMLPSVGGKSIHPEAQKLAQELGVSVFLNGGSQTY